WSGRRRNRPGRSRPRRPSWWSPRRRRSGGGPRRRGAPPPPRAPSRCRRPCLAGGGGSPATPPGGSSPPPSSAHRLVPLVGHRPPSDGVEEHLGQVGGSEAEGADVAAGAGVREERRR